MPFIRLSIYTSSSEESPPPPPPHHRTYAYNSTPTPTSLVDLVPLSRASNRGGTVATSLARRDDAPTIRCHGRAPPQTRVLLLLSPGAPVRARLLFLNFGPYAPH